MIGAHYEVWDQSANTEPFLFARAKHRDAAVELLHERRQFKAEAYDLPMDDLLLDIYLVYREEDT